MPLEAHTVFAGYTILRHLGSGPLGDVYVATNSDKSRVVALKIPFTTASADSAFCMRFRREAAYALRIWHPNLVALHNIGEFDDHVWAAMDYVDGTTAADEIARHPDGMPGYGVCTIVGAVGDALDYLHQCGLIHRSIKPANIFLTRPDIDDRQIRLADFTTGRPVRDDAELTATSRGLGTLVYAAPEELFGDHEVDGRAGRYSLAATAFHLLTGTPPFQDDDLTAHVARLVNSPPPVPGDRRPGLAHLDPVFARALAKDPDERFNRCRDFTVALAHAVGLSRY